MCFGSQTEKKTDSTQTVTPPAWLSSAAAGNVDFATGLRDQGFTPYSGSQVAPFSGQQQASFGLGNEVAGGVAPYVGQTGGLISNYANAGPSRVNASPIYSQMSPYMNAYVSQALAPQLEMQNQQFANQNKGFDAQATGAGAFGDTGWGLGRSNLTQQQDTARTGLIGNAYNAAFNTAIGAGAQDAASKLNASTTNANLRETALNRQLGGANALFAQGTGAANLINTQGGQQTAQSQADLNARYNEFLRQQYQDPQFRLQMANAGVQGGNIGAPKTTTGTSTTSAPDNSGWGMLGTLGGAALGSFVGMPGLGASMGGALGGMIGGGTAPGGGQNNNPFFGAPSGSTYAQNPNGGGYSPMFMAEGGTAEAGKPVVVGERGPELMIPSKSGVVIPHDILKAAMEKRNRERVAKAPGLAKQLGIAA